MIEIGYLSFDASVKVHFSGKYTSTKTNKIGHGRIAGYIRHIDRGTDKMNGCEVQHSNPDIDSDLTLENESYFRNENGEWQKTSQSKDMVDAITRRIDFAKEHGARISTKGKNDTVIVRPLVVQLDNDSITEHENWTWDIIEILEKEFGTNNITGFSVHKDETHPHLHISFVPCYETEKNGEMKCTISQTKFFQNPKQLAGLHRKIRKSLIDKAYDLSLENKPIEEQLAGYYDKSGEWHQQGLTPDQLKELSDRKLSLRMEMISMKIREEDLDIFEQKVREMKEKAKAQQEKLKKERVALKAQQDSLENDRIAFENSKVTVQAQLQEIAEEKARLAETKSDTEEMLEKVRTLADVCYQILSEEKHLDDKFLEFVGKQDRKTGKNNRKALENMFKKFRAQYFENITDTKRESLAIRNERSNTKNRTIYNAPTMIGSTSPDYGF